MQCYWVAVLQFTLWSVLRGFALGQNVPAGGDANLGFAKAAADLPGISVDMPTIADHARDAPAECVLVSSRTFSWHAMGPLSDSRRFCVYSLICKQSTASQSRKNSAL